MRFLISAAGTGGHVFPALEFSAECIKNNHDVLWMGTKTGLESRKVPEKNIQFMTVPMRGFRGKGLLNKFISIFLISNLIQSDILFKSSCLGHLSISARTIKCLCC